MKKISGKSLSVQEPARPVIEQLFRH